MNKEKQTEVLAKNINKSLHYIGILLFGIFMGIPLIFFIIGFIVSM